MTTAVSPRGLHPPRKPDREDDDNRYYNAVSFASDDYIVWVIGRLKLGNADLSRMASSGVPVLRSHEADSLVGVVSSVDKQAGLWRSNWRLPKIPANRDTFDQLDSGVLRGISVGGDLRWETLKIDNEDSVDWADPDSILFSADWKLIEQSLTALPADTRAGVDRAAAAILERDGAIYDTLISTTGITTLATPSLLQRLEGVGKYPQPESDPTEGARTNDHANRGNPHHSQRCH